MTNHKGLQKIKLIALFISALALFLIIKAKHANEIAKSENVESSLSASGSTGELTKFHATTNNKHAIEKLTLQDAILQIEKFNESNTSIHSRAKFAADIVSRLCANGQIEDAWQIIENTHGSVRQAQIFAFFRHANFDLEQVIEYSSKFPDPSDGYNGVRAYFISLDLEELLKLRRKSSFTELEKFLTENQHANHNLSYLIADALRSVANPLTEHQRSLAAQDLYEDKILNIKDLSGFIQPTIQDNSFDAYEYLKTKAAKDLQSQSGKKILRDTMTRMIEVDAEKSINTLMKDAKGDASTSIATGFELWSTQDSKGAYDWFVANQSQLNEAQRSSAAMGFFINAINSGEIDGAVQWNAYITDPRFRKTTDQVLKVKMKK